MKNLVLILSLLFSYAIHAQAPFGITTFLGIPVDGTKAEMKRKLIAKGFTPNNVDGHEFLEGEFNGKNVNLIIKIYKNKVWRIAIFDNIYQDKTQIIISFNKLVNQFKNNDKYITIGPDDFEIPYSENISYEMLVNNKVYDAYFYQTPIDSAELEHRNYSPIELTEEDFNDTLKVVHYSLYMKLLDDFSKKLVWFRILQYYDKYSIAIYYDNEYNKPNGEEL